MRQPMMCHPNVLVRPAELPTPRLPLADYRGRRCCHPPAIRQAMRIRPAADLPAEGQRRHTSSVSDRAFQQVAGVWRCSWVLQSAYIMPLLKKADADLTDVKFYWPISNLSVLSKLLERLVARQLLEYLTAAGLLPALQSAYRAYHSTETAVLKVLSDILLAVDQGDLAVLTLLDLSAASDTVDHAILLRRLEVSFGLGGSVHRWFTSYLSGRTQFVHCGSSRSLPRAVLFGVPQGSVLGPILFLLYTADLIRLVESHGLCPHLYADDTRCMGSVGLVRPWQLQYCDLDFSMADSRVDDSFELLRCTAANSQHPTDSHQTSLAVARCRVGSDETGLRLRHSGRST